MRKDRELIQLAGEGRSIDQIAARLEALPATVAKVAKRLGIKVGSVKDRRLKRKAK
jgi:DNA-binding NarL/FixJ family response regulator